MKKIATVLFLCVAILAGLAFNATAATRRTVYVPHAYRVDVYHNRRHHPHDFYEFDHLARASQFEVNQVRKQMLHPGTICTVDLWSVPLPFSHKTAKRLSVSYAPGC